MSTIFNILDFGAVGDGVTDSTKAIQAALDAAAECMGEVIAPPGVYMTGRLKMGPKTKLSGSAAWAFGPYGGTIFKLNTADTDCMIDISGAFGCQIHGMNLMGDELGENIHGVKLYWPVYNGGSSEDTPTIDDCKIGHFTGDGLHLEHVWCFSVRHSQMYHNRGAGLYIDGWDAFIVDNWFSGNRGGGILGGPVVASVTATGNRVEWNAFAGFAFKNGDSLNITGNFFDRSMGPALRLGYDGGIFRDTTVTGNIFRRSGKPDLGDIRTPYDSSHVWLAGAENTTIVGNTFKYGRDDNGKGIYSPNYSVIVENSDYIIVKDNTMHRGCLEENIIYDGKGEVVIEGNIGKAMPAPQD